jgi:hypothetical protein
MLTSYGMDMTPAKPTCLNKVSFKVYAASFRFARIGRSYATVRDATMASSICRWLSRTGHRLIFAKTFDLSPLSEIVKISLITPHVEVNAEE